MKDLVQLHAELSAQQLGQPIPSLHPRIGEFYVVHLDPRFVMQVTIVMHCYVYLVNRGTGEAIRVEMEQFREQYTRVLA
jgi:hypothetical protein